MKISRDVEIFICREIVIDLVFVSFIFLCGAFTFFFEGVVQYSLFAGLVGFLVGIFLFLWFWHVR